MVIDLFKVVRQRYFTTEHKKQHTEGKHENGQYCNGDRGNCMGIKHLQKLDVGSDNRNQISPVFSFQFRRAEPSQRVKYSVPDDRQQLKCNKMIAVLFSIVEHTTQYCQCDHDNCKVFRRPEKRRARSVP